MAQQRFDDTDFTPHYRQRLQGRGVPYAEVQPAYRYGWELGYNPDYHGFDWNDLEREVRSVWQHSHTLRWDLAREAIREGYSRARGEHSGRPGAIGSHPVEQAGSPEAPPPRQVRGRPLQELEPGETGEGAES